LDRLARIQREIGRTLRPVIIGGAQYIEYAASRFEMFTLLDSVPFMKGVKRQRIELKNGKCRWAGSFSLERQPIDDLIRGNIDIYGEWVESKLGGRSGNEKPPIGDLATAGQPASFPTQPR
jgi:hypothetical protein